MAMELFSQSVGLWGYLLLAVVVIIEGPVATLAGAMAAASGLMNPEGVFAAAASGNIVSDVLWYSLGYAGKMEWIERYGRYVGISKKLLQHMQDDIVKHAARLLLIAKLTLGFSIPTLIATGLARVPFRRWFPSLIIGETIWTGGLVLAGYHLTKYVQKIEHGVEVFATVGTLIGAALIIFYLGKMRQKHSIQVIEAEETHPHTTEQ